jgi:hypothetical protein
LDSGRVEWTNIPDEEMFLLTARAGEAVTN